MYVSTIICSSYDYPNIVYRLRALGFEKVVEVKIWCKMTNVNYYKVLKERGDERTWIASPALLLLI